MSNPGSIVTVTLSARVLDDAKDVWPGRCHAARLERRRRQPRDRLVREGDLAAGASVTETVRLRAPYRSPEGRPAFDAILSAQLVGVDGVIDSAAVRLCVAPEIVVEHVTFARIDDVTHEATYLAPNAPLDGVGRYDRLRIRFQVRNADTVTRRPRADPPVRRSRLDGVHERAGRRPGAGRTVLRRPRMAAAPDGSGTLPGPDVEAIPAADLQVHDEDNEAQQPATGERVMGAAGVRRSRSPASPTPKSSSR